ncbi:MAG: glycosyltransferase [Nitrospirae bacterium]|nr:glycosyltransferase [Nitrospirota bacterium]
MVQRRDVLKVSVVIPVYNGRETIRSCVESLLRQAKDVDSIEVIAVDDASTDGTLSVLSQYGSVRVLTQPRNLGPAVARNRGAAEATGELVLFTDADCIPSDNWIVEMTAPFRTDARVVGVKGIYKTRQTEITARFVQLEYEDKYDRMRRNETIDFIDTYSAAYRRSTFLEMGGFDCRFPVACAEDVDLSFRMAERGYRMVFNANASVFHLHPASWMDYIRKKYKYAYWRIVAVRKFPRKAMKDSHTPVAQKLQLLLVPLSTVALSWSFFSPLMFWAGVLGWSAVFVSMAPFISKSIKRDRLPALLTPVYTIPRAFVQCVAVVMGMLEPFIDRNAVALEGGGQPKQSKAGQP